jgi:hypothetical protein
MTSDSCWAPAVVDTIKRSKRLSANGADVHFVGSFK